MSNRIATGLTHLYAEKLHKNYKQYREDLENVEKQILELEVQISKLNQKKFLIEKEIETIEREVIDQTLNNSVDIFSKE